MKSLNVEAVHVRDPATMIWPSVVSVPSTSVMAAVGHGRRNNHEYGLTPLGRLAVTPRAAVAARALDQSNLSA